MFQKVAFHFNAGWRSLRGASAALSVRDELGYRADICIDAWSDTHNTSEGAMASRFKKGINFVVELPGTRPIRLVVESD